MAEADVVIEHPNRAKAGSKATKLVVVVLLLVSAALVLLVTVGGWDMLEGAKPLQVAYIVLYVVCAAFILRWNRGLLPVVAALAIVLAIFAAVSAPAWFDRDKPGFAQPPLNSDLLGLICVLLVLVQLLLIAFAIQAFQQHWNVEVERPRDDGPGAEPSAPARGGAPQPA